jgi:hypothetical protein
MIPIIEKLLELQKLHSSPGPLSPTAATLEQSLRAQVPKPILDHYDRLRAQGKTGVAMARHGVCGACHLRLCSGTAAGLAHQDDIHLCDNCGRYVYLSPEPAEAEPAPAPPVKKGRAARKSAGRALVLA